MTTDMNEHRSRVVVLYPTKPSRDVATFDATVDAVRTRYALAPETVVSGYDDGYGSSFEDAVLGAIVERTDVMRMERQIERDKRVGNELPAHYPELYSATKAVSLLTDSYVARLAAAREYPDQSDLFEELLAAHRALLVARDEAAQAMGVFVEAFEKTQAASA